ILQVAKTVKMISAEEVATIREECRGGLLDTTIPALAQRIGVSAETLRAVVRDHSVRAGSGSTPTLMLGEASVFVPTSSVGKEDTLGRYTGIRELDRGGMGLIYDGYDPDSKRWVAIKVLTPRALMDSRSRLKFVREARITAQLQHPNIVPVHEVSPANSETPFFSMKKVEGRTLTQILEVERKGGAAYPRQKALRDFLKICEAVSLAHSRGLIHRDLKPSNVMIGQFGEVLVMDWGLAKVVDPELWGEFLVQDSRVPAEEITEDDLGSSEADATLDGIVQGTVPYMPPEQAHGDIEMIDARSDVYSLGAILYQILTLLPPVDVLNADSMLRDVKAGRIVPPRDRTPHREIDHEIESVVQKAMAKSQSMRYSSADELRADLENYLEGRTLSAATYRPMQVLAKWVARNRTTSSVAASLLIALIGFTAFSVIQAGAEARAERLEQKNLFDEAVSSAQKEITRAESALKVEVSRGHPRNRILVDLDAKGIQLYRVGSAENESILQCREKTLGFYLSAASYLERALQIDRSNSKARSLRLMVGKAIAGLNLAGGDPMNAEHALKSLEIYNLLTDEHEKYARVFRNLRKETLEDRAARIQAILEDLGDTEENPNKPVQYSQGWIRMDEYVLECVGYRDDQTVRLLAKHLEWHEKRGRASTEERENPISLISWDAATRNGVIFCCRVLARLGRWEESPANSSRGIATSSVEALVRWSQFVVDSELLFEVGKGLCQTRSPKAMVALVQLSARIHGGRRFLMSAWNRIKPFLKLIRWSVDFADSLDEKDKVGLFHIFRDLGYQVKAMRMIDQSLKKNPTDRGNYLFRAILNQEMRKYEKAVLDYNRCLDLSRSEEQRAEVLKNRGSAFLMIEDYEAALQDYDEVLQFNPDPTTLCNRALLRLRLGDKDGAIRDAEKAMHMDRKVSRPYELLGRIERSRGQYVKALTYFNAALKINSNNAQAYYDRGLTFLLAAEDFAAKEQEVFEKHGRRDRSLWLAKHNHYQRALDDIDRTIQLDPKFALAYSYRAQLHHPGRLDNPAKAIVYYQRYLKLQPDAPDRDETLEWIQRLSAVARERGIQVQEKDK
ncbi:MAG: protein kinase, partial [Planctomycetota bacterium]|nr:protein kinase [Planctomycetota bacterium]